MTTAPVSATFVTDLCDDAEKQVRLRIKNSPVKELPEPEYRSGFLFPDIEASAQYRAFEIHYEDLNFILRLRELCELAKRTNLLVPIGLSLEDYSKLVALADKSSVYPPENPVDR